MCGITGFFQTQAGSTRESRSQAINNMLEAIAHRGPDDSGIALFEAQGLTFGFRRLSILDLSQQGHQPMYSLTGRFVIIFNGEIYNFLELRKELENLGHKFNSRSDTE